MGVEATIERAFEEGRAYRAAWKAYEAAKAEGEAGPPPRRDLRLEALAGILDGSIKIHCHCYRSDEILMLLRTAARYGVRVQSLQHVLEGYKVAAEIAAHGASASTFSDWWAYKVEAFDAIPFNAALLTQAGASVCIKSDSEELIRHLNLEAAKMVKYGGVTEAQALAMITINPARELGLDRRLGSIEVGKDADIALFNAHPFDAFARCELALIDGEVWFQRQGGRRQARAPARRPRDDARPDAEARAGAARDRRQPEGRLRARRGRRSTRSAGPDIADGTLVVADGKIAAIGDARPPIPRRRPDDRRQGPRRLARPGRRRQPRSACSRSAACPRPRTSPTRPSSSPSCGPASALHPDSELIPVTRANGILPPTSSRPAA